MGTLKEKTENTKLYIDFGILIVSFVGFLSNMISLKTFLVILLAVVIIAVIIWRDWNYPKYKEENRPFWIFCNKSKNTLIVGTILVALIALAINIAQHKFPEYQSNFMLSHFTTPKEMDELKPVNINVINTKTNSIIYFKEPNIVITKNDKSYTFSAKKLTEEMLKYSSQNFNSYSFGFIFLAFVLLVLFIIADIFIVNISKKQMVDGE